MRRYMIQIIGSSKGISDELDILSDERGIHYVDGKGLFIGTFYSEHTIDELYMRLVKRPAFLLFDITDTNTHAISLPDKYFLGLFPEQHDIVDENKPKQIEHKTKPAITKPGFEEFNKIDDILDKLSRNNYNRSCLTENELKILGNS